jgi:hypothetical protein
MTREIDERRRKRKKEWVMGNTPKLYFNTMCC